MPVRFVLRQHHRTGDEKALKMAVVTLEKMAAGGIHDHIGSGFHRYSADDRWRIPHFEKMLYDNARLAVSYVEGYQATGREDFVRVARDIQRYVEREMTSAEGAFFAATDADSLTASGRREEGSFFTWTPAETEAVLGRESARRIDAFYGVSPKGSFDGRSVLAARPADEVARERVAPPDLQATVADARERLYAARARRPAPLRDEKVVTAWNGLMISAFARAALALGDESYARGAERAASFLLGRSKKDGRLSRTYTVGRAGPSAYLPDYAFLIAGLLDLHEATGESRWLSEAVALDRVLESSFEDKRAGGFFLTAAEEEAPLARQKPDQDGAEPSGNSVHALNLMRLHLLTDRHVYRERAEETLRAFSGTLTQAPEGSGEMLVAADFFMATPKEVVIVVPGSRTEAEPFLRRLRSVFLPHRVLITAVEGSDFAEQARVIPLLEDKKARHGRAMAYVCEKQTCKLPTSDPDVFERQITQSSPPRQ
jgi:uncharacterized protein